MQDLFSPQMLSLAMALLLLWVGVNLLVNVVRLNKTYELTANRFLYPANCRPEDCKNVAGFIRFMTPRMIAFGVLCLLFAVFVTLQSMTALFSELPPWIGNGLPLLLFLPLFVWYVIFINKAAKRFW